MSHINNNAQQHTPWFLSKKYRVFFHLAFWLFYIVTISFFLGDFFGIKRILLRTTIAAGFIAVLTYFNIYYLLPSFFEKKKFVQYLVAVNASVAVIAAARFFSDFYFPVDLITAQQSEMRQYMFSAQHITSIFLSSYIILLLTSSIKFIKDYFINIYLRNQLKYQKTKAELKQLKHQLNPHFLFNVLSNIHSLIHFNSEMAAPMVLRLSDLMRYVLYKCNTEKVQLSKEIEYLQNFIALHQLQKENRMNIKFDVEGDIGRIKIEPLLFLPVFENCFKHGNLIDLENGWMKSKLAVVNNSLYLSVQNTYIEQLQEKSIYGGIGNKNMSERLSLLYKNHHLETEHGNGIHSVKIEIFFGQP